LQVRGAECSFREKDKEEVKRSCDYDGYDGKIEVGARERFRISWRVDTGGSRTLRLTYCRR
jgi:hypothetical protein